MLSHIKKHQLLHRYFSEGLSLKHSVSHSTQLIKTVTDPIYRELPGSIIELGSGAGFITDALVENVLQDTKVVLYESKMEHSSEYRSRYGYPCFKTIKSLRSYLTSIHLTQVDCIISGLPLQKFPAPLRERFLDDIFSCLRPQGKFIAYSNSSRMKWHLIQRFDIETIHYVPFNFPPTFIYHCSRLASDDTWN